MPQPVSSISLTFLQSVTCGEDLRAYYDCENP